MRRLAVLAALFALAACSSSSDTGGSTKSWATIAAGQNHTCALTPSGAAFCWGSDLEGELGDGPAHDGTYSASPVAVSGGLQFAEISAGGSTTCGVTLQYAAYCWGANDGGGALGIGDSTIASKDVPTAVAGGHTFRSISVELQHGCAVTTANQAFCWGQNHNGATGNVLPNGIAPSPLAVTGSIAFATISAGYQQQSCGVNSDGAAYCWGINGLLGTADTSPALYAPNPVQGSLTFATLHTNANNRCGVVTTGAAYCWGDGRYGQVGSDSLDFIAQPAAVADAHTYSDAEPAQFGHFSCGLGSDAIARCWGSEPYVFGDTSSAVHRTPVGVAGGMLFARLSVGGDHVCGLTNNGDVYCWGTGTYGQLGNGGTTPSAVPVKVAAP